MTDERRKTLAFLCGMYFLNTQCSGIFDYSRGSFFYLDYSIKGGEISVYDHERKCELSGIVPSFHDYGESCFVDLKVKRDGVIDIYDYKTATDLEAICKEKNVSLFDYKVGRYYEYQLG